MIELLLMLLTFVRKVELRKVEWREFDLDRVEWRVPAERMRCEARTLPPCPGNWPSCSVN